MSFIIKLLLFFSISISAIFFHYKSFDYQKRVKDLELITNKIYINPAFIFKSKEYKEFVYVK